jgi:small-conductance mechanosensitive channel
MPNYLSNPIRNTSRPQLAEENVLVVQVPLGADALHALAILHAEGFRSAGVLDEGRVYGAHCCSF